MSYHLLIADNADVIHAETPGDSVTSPKITPIPHVDTISVSLPTFPGATQKPVNIRYFYAEIIDPMGVKVPGGKLVELPENLAIVHFTTTYTGRYRISIFSSETGAPVFSDPVLYTFKAPDMLKVKESILPVSFLGGIPEEDCMS